MRLCFGNTWAWPADGDLRFEWFSTLMGGPLGRFGSERYCTFVNLIVPASMQRRRLGKNEMERSPMRAADDRQHMRLRNMSALA